MNNLLKVILVVCGVSLSPTSQALELNLAREVATTTIIVDWLQTREIAKDPTHSEGQIHKIIGVKPTKASVNWYFASKIAAHYAINEYLGPSLTRNWYNGLTIVGGIDVINHNYSVGLRIEL